MHNGQMDHHTDKKRTLVHIQNLIKNKIEDSNYGEHIHGIMREKTFHRKKKGYDYSIYF